MFFKPLNRKKLWTSLQFQEVYLEEFGSCRSVFRLFAGNGLSGSSGRKPSSVMVFFVSGSPLDYKSIERLAQLISSYTTYLLH